MNSLAAGLDRLLHSKRRTVFACLLSCLYPQRSASAPRPLVSVTIFELHGGFFALQLADPLGLLGALGGTTRLA